MSQRAKPGPLEASRTPVLYFNFIRNGKDLGWVGYCESISESMIPVLMHPGQENGAEQRAAIDPPKVIGVYNGQAFVPYSWIKSAIKDDGYLNAVESMNVAAQTSWKEVGPKDKASAVSPDKSGKK